MKKEDNDEELEEEKNDDSEDEQESFEDDPKEAKKEVAPTPLDKSALYAVAKIKAYLDDAASKDELFKAKYNPTEENLANCFRYIANEVHSSKRDAIQHQEMFAMAFEFFNDGIVLKKQADSGYTHGKVMAENDKEDSEINSALALTDAEKKSMHDKALSDFEKQEKAKLDAKAKADDAAKAKVEKKEEAKAIKAEKAIEAKKEKEAAKVGADQLSFFDI